MSSSKLRYQPIYDIAELCSKKGLENVVLCPGSRCAPLTIAFTRHPSLTTRTFSDERSAAFVGLGIAQQSKNPVVLVCTSGSAAYNFAPAVAEAFFAQTPLIIFTADRPAEWIGQHDGQTIFQDGIFGKHVKRSYQLPQDYEHTDSQWAINRIVNEAINLSLQEPKGPVHINAPFREPLYPSGEDAFAFSKDVRVIETWDAEASLDETQKQKLAEQFNTSRRILVVAAQRDADEDLSNVLSALSSKHQIPVVVDVVSNINFSDVIQHSDLFLGQAPEKIKTLLQPDLLITFGKSLISKNLKLFLRANPPARHWHIQKSGVAADPLKHISDVLSVESIDLFTFLHDLPVDESFEHQKQVNFKKLWEVEERRAVRALTEAFPDDQLSELRLVKEVMDILPPETNLHLANSMSVRYANFIGLTNAKKKINVFCNRGTSGIDGCTSTAVGHSLNSTQLNVLITGDLAFFYDRNAFWHNYPLPNLRILLLNNHGGLIFGVIDGPASLPESREYFVTRQALSANKLCEEFGFDYLKLDNRRKLKNTLKDFFDPEPKTKILELETDLELNKTVFDNLKQKIKQSYES